MKVQLDLIGVDALAKKLGRLSESGREASRKLLAKGAATIASAIRSRTPVQPQHRSKQRTRIHLKSAISTEERTYNKGETVVQMIGPPAKQQPHGWLVEEGTRKRVTNSKRVKIGRQVTGHTERVYYRKLKDGTRKRSTYIKNTYQAQYKSERRRKRSPQLNRGRMPAFHMFRDGANSTMTRVHSMLVDGLRSEIAAVAGGGS